VVWGLERGGMKNWCLKEGGWRGRIEEEEEEGESKVVERILEV
jgi:hypothetical protein